VVRTILGLIRNVICFSHPLHFPSSAFAKTAIPQHSLHMSILRLYGVMIFSCVSTKDMYPTITSFGFARAKSSMSARVYNALTRAFSYPSTSRSETENGGLTCSFFVTRCASARKRRASLRSGSISTREFALTVNLAVFSMRQPGFEIRRIVCEGVKVAAESQREEYSVREASEVSSKMPREMSSEVVPLRLITARINVRDGEGEEGKMGKYISFERRCF
jgi:hypothetical protein